MADAVKARAAAARQAITEAGGLVNQTQVGVIIGRNKSTTSWHVRGKDFPAPVYDERATRLWLRAEIEQWKREHPKT
jgi:predicted DNA-binding transcriptional regulator AlpA